MSTISTDRIYYTGVCGDLYHYEPKDHVSVLDWFNIARCARERMSASVCDIHRWRGERRSFYAALRMMDVEDKTLLD